MGRELFSILYLFVFFICLYMYKKRIRTNGFIGAYGGLLLGFIIYYGLVPFIMSVFSSYYLDKMGDYRYARILTFFFGESITDWEIIRASLMVLVGIFGIEFGYRVKRRIKTTYTSINGLSDNNFFFFMKIIAAITLIGGGLAVLLYVFAFGGLSQALSLAETLRQHYSSVTDYGISGIYSYFLMLSGVLTIAPVLYYYVWKKEKSGFHFCLLVISVILAGIYLLLNSGKSAVLRLGVVFLLTFMYERKVKHKVLWFSAIVIVGLPIIDVLDALFAQENIGETIKNFSYLYGMREFAVPAELTFNMGKITEKYGYMYFTHFVTDILDILPGVSFETSFANTSEFMKGINWIKLGGTPNDFITYGFLQLRGIGVFFVSAIWGYISGWLDNMIGRISDKFGQFLIGITIAMNMVSVITCADISSTLLYNLSFILTAFILIVYYKRARKTRK